jgi:glycosyltransferase involved in cell wall biosynthesis
MRFLMLNWRDPENPMAGGAERVTLAFLSALAQRGHETFWFANGFDNCAPVSTISGIKIIRGRGIGWSIIDAIKWYQHQPGFDLVIDQHHGIPWYAPWWCKTNCIAYLHEVLGPIWDAFYKFPKNIIGKTQEWFTHKLYRNIPFWTPSESTKKILIAHGVRYVQVIPNGIDPISLPVLDDKQITPSARLITVSRLAPNKRIQHAILALKILRSMNFPCTLEIVGDGACKSELQKLTAQLGLQNSVSFAGAIPEQEKNERLRQAHLLLHPSMREGWGLNVIEANAMGTPAIVYPVHGLVDSTIHDQTGIITRAETPEAIATEIADLISKPEKYARLRLNAWERAKLFHWDKVLPIACEWLEKMARTKH